MTPPAGALDIDEIRRLIQAAFLSPDQEAELLSLRAEDAQRALDEMWKSLELPLDHAATIGFQSRYGRNKLRRISLKLANKFNALPRSIFLAGVKCTESEQFDGGGFADVFMGEYDTGTVVIKRLRGPANRQAFCRESLLWKNLDHRHVLKFLGVSQDCFTSNSLSMVLPFMSMGNLRHHLKKLRAQGNIDDIQYHEAVDEWLFQIASGLTYLHDEDVVHGDLHGGNVLLDDNGYVQLTDFGMSLVGSATAFNYGSMHGGGKQRWLAPELIEPSAFDLENKRPSRASDIFSFGCTCIELYTCQDPFHGMSTLHHMNFVVEGGRPQRPKLPKGRFMADGLWFLVLACMQQQPAARPPSMSVLRTLGRITLMPSGVASHHGRYRAAPSILLAEMQRIFAEQPSPSPAIEVAVTDTAELQDNDSDEEHEEAHQQPVEVLQPQVEALPLYKLVVAFTSKFDFDIMNFAEIWAWFGSYGPYNRNPDITPESLMNVIAMLPCIDSVEPEWQKAIQWSSPEWADSLWDNAAGWHGEWRTAFRARSNRNLGDGDQFDARKAWRKTYIQLVAVKRFAEQTKEAESHQSAAQATRADTEEDIFDAKKAWRKMFLKLVAVRQFASPPEPEVPKPPPSPPPRSIAPSISPSVSPSVSRIKNFTKSLKRDVRSPTPPATPPHLHPRDQSFTPKSQASTTGTWKFSAMKKWKKTVNFIIATKRFSDVQAN